MKKSIGILLALAALLCLSFGLAACGGNGGGGHTHDWSSEWAYDGTYHWHECLADGCTVTADSGKSGYAAHSDTDGDGYCDICEYDIGTADADNTVAVTSVTLNPSTLSLAVGGNATLTATVLPANATDSAVTWSSSDSSVATVSNGTVTAVSVGTATITASAGGKSATCTVTVSENAITFNTLYVDGNTVYGKVANSVEIYSFNNEITASNASYTVCTDLACTQTVPSKTVNLEVGDNTFYILATYANDEIELFTVTVRRRPVYTVTFETDGTSVSAQYIEEDSEVTPAEQTEKTGYTFNYWTYGGVEVAFPYTVTEDIAFTAAFTANTYTVTLAPDGGEVSPAAQSVTYDGSFTLPVPVRTGYSFTGWYIGDTQLTDEAGASLSAWGYAQDSTVTAGWSINSYTVTATATTGGSVSGGGSYNYNSVVNLTATTSSGYTFLGWYCGEELAGTELSLSFTLGAADVSYEARWIVCPVTLERNDTAAGTVSGVDKTVAGMQTTITAKTNNGYTWLGWYSGDTLLTDELNYTFTMPSSSSDAVTYTAKWTYYTLTTLKNDTSAGTVTSYSSTKVTAGTNVTITATTYLGYTFLGWYNGTQLLTENTSYTFTMPQESLSYTATWEVNAEMQNFTFTSTTTTLTITGVSDKTVTAIIVPDYTTSISSGAFSGCSSLQSITLPYVGSNASATSASKSTLFGYIFGTSSYTGGTATKQYYIANSYYAIYYIPTSLKTVTITGGNILYGAFCYCASLESVTIPSSVSSIGDRVFGDCTGLKSIIIPDSVTYIDTYAFASCTSLTNIAIPDGVTSIGAYAFDKCSSLTTVYYGGSATNWNAISIGSYNTKLTGATRYYYSEEEPTGTGNYWHYVDGEIVIWNKES